MARGRKRMNVASEQVDRQQFSILHQTLMCVDLQTNDGGEDDVVFRLLSWVRLEIAECRKVESTSESGKLGDRFVAVPVPGGSRYLTDSTLRLMHGAVMDDRGKLGPE